MFVLAKNESAGTFGATLVAISLMAMPQPPTGRADSPSSRITSAHINYGAESDTASVNQIQSMSVESRLVSVISDIVNEMSVAESDDTSALLKDMNDHIWGLIE